jgi:hypothetical protein
MLRITLNLGPVLAAPLRRDAGGKNGNDKQRSHLAPARGAAYEQQSSQDERILGSILALTPDLESMFLARGCANLLQQYRHGSLALSRWHGLLELLRR